MSKGKKWSGKVGFSGHERWSRKPSAWWTCPTRCQMILPSIDHGYVEKEENWTRARNTLSAKLHSASKLASLYQLCKIILVLVKGFHISWPLPLIQKKKTFVEDISLQSDTVSPQWITLSHITMPQIYNLVYQATSILLLTCAVHRSRLDRLTKSWICSFKSSACPLISIQAVPKQTFHFISVF